MALSKDELEVIRRFSRMPEYRAWLAVLEKRLSEVDAKLRTASGEELFRQQGRAQMLDELLGEAAKAAQILNQGEKSRQMKGPGIFPT